MDRIIDMSVQDIDEDVAYEAIGCLRKAQKYVHYIVLYVYTF